MTTELEALRVANAKRRAQPIVDLKGNPIELPWGGDTADLLVEKMRRAGGIARSADLDIMSQIIRYELRARDAALREKDAEIERLTKALADHAPEAKP